MRAVRTEQCGNLYELSKAQIRVRKCVIPAVFTQIRASVITSAGYYVTISWPPWAQHLFDVIMVIVF